MAGLVTLIAVFYLEEDWRGRHAWENFKNDAGAKGIALDWDKFIPSAVPDDQNFFTASTNIVIRFKKAQTEAETKAARESSWLNITYGTNSFPVFDNAKSKPLLVATITTAPPAAASPALGARSADLVASFADPRTPERAQALIQKIIGRTATGSAGFEFSELQISNLVPAQILLLSDTSHPVADLENLVPKDLITNLGQFQIQVGGARDTFQVLLANVRVTTAAGYLKWSDQFVPAFNEVREALKRPAAILPGDYSEPVAIPVPNFVTMRTIAQTLAQRAQCHMLLDQPDEAVRELTLIHDVCKILRRPPAGKPITLVESMINVAIAGLYASTIADGFRLHAWHEPQLAALQQQLEEEDLASLVVDSLNSEQAFACYDIINLPSPELQKVLWGDRTRWQRLQDPEYLFSNFAPRGWLYRNAIDHVVRMQQAIQACDVSNQLISPKTITDWLTSLDRINRWSPYSFTEAVYMPNLTKATQITAYNQTLLNEAELACALERYHIKYGQYPDTLDALAPEFIKNVPHDIIGGQPLHYRSTDNGKFLLYSIGWNEKDDGGTVAYNKNGIEDRDNGDWVWKN